VERGHGRIRGRTGEKHKVGDWGRKRPQGSDIRPLIVVIRIT
jgi:hypothetical protein